MEKALNDKVCKIIEKTMLHFVDELGLAGDDAVEYSINFHRPLFEKVLDAEAKDKFWLDFLKISINETNMNFDGDNMNVDVDYVKLVMENYNWFLLFHYLLKKDEFNMEIVERKIN